MKYKLRQRFDNNYIQLFKNKWQKEWLKINTKLNEIKRTTKKWNNPIFIKRRDEVILNRLRIGHTLFHTCPFYEKRTTLNMSNMYTYFH